MDADIERAVDGLENDAYPPPGLTDEELMQWQDAQVWGYSWPPESP